MKTNVRKSCFVVARICVLDALAVCFMLLPGCTTAGDFAEAGAGATVGIMGAGMATELARDLLFKGLEGVDKGRSNASIHPSLPEELAEARKVAVLFGKAYAWRVRSYVSPSREAHSSTLRVLPFVLLWTMIYSIW